MTLRELHLFAGIGGGILGGMLLGHRCVGAVEINPHCRRVLEARQCDGILDSFPIHDDIRTFSGTAWRGRVDVVCGGFPCQDISLAGSGAGLAGERSGLWWEMLRVVREVGPRFVFVENVPGLFVRGLDQVLGSLADLGFDAEWLVLSAADCGAPHLRKRVWILARSRQSTDPDADSRGREGERVAQHSGQQGQCGNEPDRLGAGRRGHGPAVAGAVGRSDAPAHREVADPSSVGRGARRAEPAGEQGRSGAAGRSREVADAGESRLPLPEPGELSGEIRHQEGRAAEQRSWWSSEPRVGRVAHGVPSRVDRLRSLGNAQVPQVAAAAFRELISRLKQEVRDGR